MNQAIPPDPRIASLEAENQALRARMAYLLEQVERNHDIMCRHQAFDLEIVSASTFPELIGTIFRTLPVISDLDGVTLSLLDEDDDIVLVMEKLGVDFSAFPQLLFVHAVAELGFAAPKPVAALYPAGAQGRLGGGGGLHQRTGRSGLGKTRAHKRGCPITLYRWSL